MITDTTKNNMLDHIVLDRASLHTAFSATGANEVTGGTPAYARQAITMAAASGGSRAASTQPAFDVPAGTTVAFIGLWTNAGTVFRGMTPNGGSEKSFQVDTSANERIYCEGHGYVNNDRVVFLGGTAPTGLTEGTIYHVVGATSADPDYFQVSLTQGGSAENITGQAATGCKVSKVVLEAFAGQGTHTVTALTFGLNG